MIAPRRQIELAHRRPHQTLTFVLQFAELPDLPNPHIRIAEDRMFGIQLREALPLTITRLPRAQVPGSSGKAPSSQ
jgi:hypothetical protein